ncbi:MAG: ASKHA domain-containing protein, partial [Pseudomonadota bacterium]
LDRTGLLNAGSHPHIRDNTFFLSCDESVALTGGDIATLQKAQSAVSTVFRLLLKSMGLKANSLEKVFIAGAFGSRLNVVNAMTTGLLPTLPAERYVLAGNTALVGASMMLVSEKLRQKAHDLAGSIVHCDLTSDPEFEEMFIDGLYFPVK